MSSNQPQQLEIPAPDAPAPRCRGCNRKVFPERDASYSIGAAAYVCADCYADVGAYWTRDRMTPEQPADADTAHEGGADALHPLAQAVRRYAALRAASQPAMKGPRHG